MKRRWAALAAMTGPPWDGARQPPRRLVEEAGVRPVCGTGAPGAGVAAAVAAPLPAGLAFWSRTISFWAALFIFPSNLATHALNRTCENTSGMAVIRPRAVANRARPMDPAWSAAPPPPP